MGKRNKLCSALLSFNLVGIIVQKLIVSSFEIRVHAITSRLNPVRQPRPQTPPNGIPSRPEPASGLEVMETENFRLQCFTTLTGTKFLVFTDTTQANVDVTTRRIYELYSDYVMKNPFYQLEMPVRCEMFDRKLNSYIREINNR